MTRTRRRLWRLPWLVALICLAVPMIGSGFVGWPFVVGWLVLILVVWWVQPVGGAERSARLTAGVVTLGLLALLGTLGGFYLMPSVIIWMTLVATTAPAVLGTQSVS